MCNFQPVLNYLNTAYAAIVTAIVLIGTAAIANASFFGAAGSPALMVLAGVATGFAIFLLGVAAGRMDTFISCTGKLNNCIVNKIDFDDHIKLLRIVLGIQATACFAVAVFAWIPGAALFLMYTIGSILIIQLGFITTTIIYTRSLINCVQPRDSSNQIGD